VKRLVQAVVLVAVVAAVVAASASSFAVVADPLPTGVVGTKYEVRPEIHGGGAPYLFSLEGGTLPAGMHIGSDDACICGTPQEAGTFVFNILGYTGVDNPKPWDHTDSPDFTLHIRPQVVITSTSLNSAFVGTPYSAKLTAEGAAGYSVEWSLSAGALPAGLSLASDGTISGTPTALGTAFFTVRVKDSDSGPRSDTHAMSLAVITPLTASLSGAVPQAEVGVPFKLALTSSGGLAPTSWSISAGTAPPGVTIDPATGLLSGTPTSPGTFTFTATVADSGGNSVPVNVTVNVVAAVKLLPAKLRAGVVGKRYAARLKALGGAAPKTFKFVGKHPSWLHLNARTGALSGKPTKAGKFSFSVKVTDSLKAVSTKKFTLTVRAY
jgi:Putative Ig domain